MKVHKSEQLTASSITIFLKYCCYIIQSEYMSEYHNAGIWNMNSNILRLMFKNIYQYFWQSDLIPH